MDDSGKDDVPMLSRRNWHSVRHDRKVSHMNRSVTISIPMTKLESVSGETNHVGLSGPLRSDKKAQQEQAEQEQTLNHQRVVNDNVANKLPWQLVYGGAKRWGQRAQEKLSLMKQSTCGVMNPHSKAVQQWNKFIVISCIFAIIMDPMFFYTISTNKEHKCIVINWPMTKVIVVLRSMTDFIYFLHMLLQFRLAFVSPESGVVGAGDLVDHPKKIALHYLSGKFFTDLFIVLPLPQIIVLTFLPHSIGSSMPTAILVQYIPRLFRFLPLLVAQYPTNVIYESAWSSFLINLLTIGLVGHVVGSCWYLFGLQRVNQCLRYACHHSGFLNCKKLIDSGYESFRSSESDTTWNDWKQNVNSTACFEEDSFPYGIYVKAVNLTAESSIIRRYIYSFFWGFQQISTMAGNLVPSYFEGEVIFTIIIVGLGLLLFAVLFVKMQSFLQALGRRELEMSLRRRDLEQWMNRRHLPMHLRIKVRQSEEYNWASTQGVNEENLMENLPEDLQRDIRHHLFEFIKKVRIFAAMDEPILDAICERLRQKTYVQGGTPLYEGGIITKMVFIVRGKMESVGEDGKKVPLSEGDSCGEELLMWCLEQSSDNGDTRNQRKLGYRLLSKRTVKCLTNVEAFILKAADLEEVTTLFAGFLRSHRVQLAIRNESPYEQGKAATTIQVKWRYIKKKLCGTNTSKRGTLLPSKFK
uniref:probable cyclic nucleotide-gated ion channel 20, chloroplastic n=1 Tax=Erigeron canadensis TaxID=72917 RepID=UPI001CB9B993|nr:probable cyclic nucleotide-gated ion channel 20, chloroplastic [Erigeron canadensis]